MRPLLQLALVISCFIALKNIPDSESSVLYKTPFRELTEIEKEKTAIDDYLIALYHLQFVRKEYDSRNSICTSMESGLKKNRDWAYEIYLSTKEFNIYRKSRHLIQIVNKLKVKPKEPPKVTMKKVREASEKEVLKGETNGKPYCNNIKSEANDLMRDVKCLRYLMRLVYNKLDCDEDESDIKPKQLYNIYKRFAPILHRVSDKLKKVKDGTLIPKVQQSAPVKENVVQEDDEEEEEADEQE